MTPCAVCEQPLNAPCYRSDGAASLSSLCQLHAEPTRVAICSRCAHLQTEPLPDVSAYYASDYTILIDSEEEDQLYEVRDGQPVYRFDHQVQNLLNTLHLPSGARLLDFGCAKSSTLKKLLALRPDVKAHLFDVSDMYRDFWGFVPAEQQATHQLPDHWLGSFDAVCSFFALEHVPDPVAELKTIGALLKPGGRAYFIVPNVFSNTGDFVVLDHINHFTEPSLRCAIARAGLRCLSVNATSHRGAWVVQVERAPPEDAHWRAQVSATVVELSQLADFWSDLSRRVRAFEAAHPTGPLAIYGASFYGSYLYACLRDASRVVAFVDRSPFLQGRQQFNTPIVAPHALPANVSAVLVGLNPAIAEQAIGKLSEWSQREHSLFFL